MSGGDRIEVERRIFEQACELAAGERAAFLDRECGGDPTLRARIEALLAADSAAGTELDTPAVAGLRESLSRPDELPERVGPYRILGLLGRGGMGVVYEAEQESPARRVALKVVRPGLVTESLLRRFEHEARVLGWLNHPGIAQIYEAGTADSGSGLQPFFAMELIRGVPLTRFAQERNLDHAARLELLARVCDAVQHAHQKGVIHRDLKPGNVLVDDSGQPKVLDFGVARVTDADLQATTLHTHTGELVGTLSYMSPEQVGGEPDAVDTRSDVYALGVIAHELLSGQLPFDLRGKMVHEAARAILEDEPSTLGVLNADLRGDVETIVAKSLEKEKERRYASAEELASDIRRFLNDEAIVARPTSAIYQLQKFAHRNKALFAGLAGVFVSLAAGTVVSTLLYRDASRGWSEETRQRELAQESEARAIAAERDARTAEAKAQTEADVAEEVARFLVSIFKVADPTADDDWSRDITAREVLDSGRDRIAGELEAHPHIRTRLLEELGKVYRNLGLYDDSKRLFEEALELRAAEGDEVGMAGNRALIALATAQAHRPAIAEPLLSEALEAIRSADVTHHESDLLSSLAFVQSLLGRFDEAEATARAAVAVAAENHGSGSRSELIAQGNLVVVLTKNEFFDAAIEEARDNLERLSEHLGAEHPDTSNAKARLGMALTESGDPLAALPYLREVHARHEALFADAHPSRIAAMNNLAIALMRAKESAEALELSGLALELSAERFGTENRRYALGLHNLATILSDLGRYQESERRSAEAQAILEPLEPDSPLIANVLAVRGETLGSQLGKPVEALPLLERAVEIQSTIPGATPLLRANAVNALSMVLIRLGRLDLAETQLLELLALYREAHGPDHDLVARTLNNLGKVAMDRADHAGALQYMRQSHAILEEVLPEGHVVFGYTFQGMGRALIALERFAEAEVEVRAALAIRAAGLPAGHPLTAECRSALADCLAAQGHPAEAEALLLEALATFEATYPEDHDDVLRTRERLVELYESTGRAEEAERYR